jgi:hypothetical protein
MHRDLSVSRHRIGLLFTKRSLGVPPTGPPKMQNEPEKWL